MTKRKVIGSVAVMETLEALGVPYTATKGGFNMSKPDYKAFIQLITEQEATQ